MGSAQHAVLSLGLHSHKALLQPRGVPVCIHTHASLVKTKLGYDLQALTLPDLLPSCRAKHPRATCCWMGETEDML